MTSPELEISQLPDITTLDENARQEHPTIIFEQVSDSATDRLSVTIALNAAREAGLQLVGDLTYDNESGTQRAAIRTASKDRWAPKVESALVVGALHVVESTLRESQSGSEGLNMASSKAREAVRQIVDDTELYENFSEYYGGLRWGTDQEKFTTALFTAAAEFDPAVLEKNITGSVLRSVTYMDEDMDIPYEERKHWDDKTAEEIFKSHPELDYRRLADPAFASSPEGQRMQKTYAKFIGYEQAQSYRQYDRQLNARGDVIPKPLVPLAKFPLIEGLMVSEVALTKPHAKYDFGPREVIGLVLESDSRVAIAALTETLTTRLPAEERYVWDGPTEFQQKRRNLHDLTATFMQETEPERRAFLKEQLLGVFAGYINDGPIASEIREKHFAEAERELTWHRDTEDVKDIVKDVLSSVVAAPEARDFIHLYWPESEQSLVLRSDPLLLTRAQQLDVLLTAYKHIDENSNATVFEKIAKRLFAEGNTAYSLKYIASEYVKAAQLRHTPAVNIARLALRSAGFSLDDKTDKQREAKEAFDEATAPAKEHSERARMALNDTLIEQLTLLVDVPAAEIDHSVFKVLLEHVSFGDTSNLTRLPKIYDQLLALGMKPGLPDGLRTQIAYAFEKRLQYAYDEDTRRLLPAVILDIYRMMLGSPDDIKFPTSDIALGLAAATGIAGRQSIFRFASDDQLLELSRYHQALVDVAERVRVRQLAGDLPVEGLNEDDDYQDPIRSTERAVEYIEQLEQMYKEFLHIEDVKVYPHIYYPWLMERLMPFWQKMNWEVSPGNRPTREIQELYNVLSDHIGTKLVKEKELSEDFDVMAEGHLDSLLLECYRRMVVPHDIKYNTTVWQDGLTFMHYAVSFMPEAVYQQFVAKHAGQTQFLGYLARERERWNK